jgi:transcriptional regulator with XRE-family HTH domain
LGGQNTIADFDPERLRAAREAAGLNQRELAERIGKPTNAIAKWEGGFRSPYAGNLGALAAALGVQPADLRRADGGPRTLLDLRVAAGLTQLAAAARARLVRSRYSAIERGEVATVADDVIETIATALGFTPAEVRTAHSASRAEFVNRRLRR